MTPLAVCASLLLAFAPAQAQTKPPAPSTTRTVSLVDLLVEAQTLYTLAVDKQQESLTAALELVRQAQRVVADDTVRKRLPAGVRPDTQDLTVLGALRARISILAGSIENRLAFLSAKSKEIRALLESQRLSSATREMAAVETLLPIDDTLYQIQPLRAELLARQKDLSAAVQAAEAAMASREYATAERLWREAALIDRDQLFEDPIRRAQELDKASRPGPNKALLHGILWTAVLAGSGVVVHEAMIGKQDEMYVYPPGSYPWRTLYDDAEQLRKVRNGLYAAAFGVGTAFAIYGAVKGNASPSRSAAPRTWVGFNIDPRRPAFLVVRTF